MERPSSPACARNREPILAVLRPWFADRRQMLEIGSGTGEHAVHFAAAMPQLVWQTSGRADQLPGIRAWLDPARLPHTPPTVTLDVNGRWPVGPSTRCSPPTRCTSWADPRWSGYSPHCRRHAAPARGWRFSVVLHERDHPTSASHAAFDAALWARDPRMGLRDRATVDDLAATSGLKLQRVVPMPSNKLCMRYRREA